MSAWPTPVVILMLPRAGEDSAYDPIASKLKIDPFAEEMGRRVRSGTLSGWQWRWALEHTGVFRTRAKWPEGSTVLVGLWTPQWLSGATIRATVAAETGGSLWSNSPKSMVSGSFGEHSYTIVEAEQQDGSPTALRDGRMRLSVQVAGPSAVKPGTTGGFAWSGDISLPARMVRTVDEAITPANSERINAAVRRATTVEVAAPIGSTAPAERFVAVSFDPKKSPELWGTAMCYSINLVRDGVLVRTVPFKDDLNSGKGYRRVVYESVKMPEFYDDALAPGDVGHWTLRVRGELGEALADFDRDKYWTGELEYPLKDVLTR